MEIRFRSASPEDAQSLLDIYAPYVKETAITFEYEVPSASEFRQRITNTLKNYPYIVAEADGVIAGYAYAGPFHAREAYKWNAETSIYIKKDSRRYHIGSALLNELESRLKAMGILNVNACIAKAVIEDEHLTNASIHFHEKMNYKLVGEFHNSGFKFNTWYNMVWMEKFLGEHTANPVPPSKPLL